MNSILSTYEFRKRISLLVALFPILDIYATPLPGISIGEFLLFSIFIYCAFKKSGMLFSIPTEFAPFFSYFLYGSIVTLSVISFCRWANPNTMLYDLGSKVLFFSILLLSLKFCIRKELVKYLIIIANIVSAFFIFQYALRMVGINISGIISFLPLSNTVDTAHFIQGQQGSARCSSLFAEPAHLCEFMTLPLCLSALGRNKNIRRFIIYLSVLLLSRSANGFAISGIVLLGIIIFRILRLKNNGLKVFVLSSAICLCLIIVPVLGLIFNDYVQRFAEISGDPSQRSVNGLSSYIRVLRGYSLFVSFPVFEQIVGQGFGCILSYVANHDTSFYELTSELPDYVNSIQSVLISTGYIGLVLMTKQIYGLFRKCHREYKLALLSLVALTASATILFTPVSILIFTCSDE